MNQRRDSNDFPAVSGIHRCHQLVGLFRTGIVAKARLRVLLKGHRKVLSHEVLCQSLCQRRHKVEPLCQLVLCPAPGPAVPQQQQCLQVRHGVNLFEDEPVDFLSAFFVFGQGQMSSLRRAPIWRSAVMVSIAVFRSAKGVGNHLPHFTSYFHFETKHGSLALRDVSGHTANAVKSAG